MFKTFFVTDVNTLTNSKIDVIKQVYAGLLYLCTEFTRQNQTKENVKQFLTETCNFNEARAEIFAEMYRKNKQGVEISLLNIGNHIQHVIDVKWKIDYIVKVNIKYQFFWTIIMTNLLIKLQSNNIDQFSGPLFRISIITESNNQVKKVNEINFVCNRQELQDLVYKLKDASKHCNKLTTDN